MNKADSAGNDADELRPEYRCEEFGAMVRGKCAAEMRETANVVVLDADVAEAFPNGQAVNEALYSLLELARVAARVSPPTAHRTHESPIG